jgi:hypothetical protein
MLRTASSYFDGEHLRFLKEEAKIFFCQQLLVLKGTTLMLQFKRYVTALVVIAYSKILSQMIFSSLSKQTFC